MLGTDRLVGTCLLCLSKPKVASDLPELRNTGPRAEDNSSEEGTIEPRDVAINTPH